ncbi:MAG: S8 family serine peptidase, partial [Myxococcota bacterium]
MRGWIWFGLGALAVGCQSSNSGDRTVRTSAGGANAFPPPGVTISEMDAGYGPARGSSPSPSVGVPIPPSGLELPGRPPRADPAEPPAPGTIDPNRPALLPQEGVWDGSTVLVAPVEGVTVEELAATLGVTVVEPSGAGGFASLSVPPGVTAGAFTLQLVRHPQVASASRMSTVAGTFDWATSMALRDHVSQWHLESAKVPWLPNFALSNYVVAVLDTGVAYENYADGEHTYTRASTLSGVEFVAPADFVNGDDHANDDHGHGTHIASLIASRGELDGVAAGVALMPVKVLDENNAGTELALVRGIRHAVDHGAHVINMSLSFPLGYVPSPALVAAIEHAHHAGVVMVAASGNVGADLATWPAASRLVIGVGALAPGLTGSDADPDYVEEVGYSNLAAGLDVLAPGGS